MASAVIDGMDVLNVYRDLRSVIDDCREHCRPAFVDMRTYRYKGHSMSDPRKYRTKDEEARYESEDPIERLAGHLKADHGYTDEAHDGLRKEVRRQVRDALDWAEKSPPPDLRELYTDVYTHAWGPYHGTTPPPMMAEED
jgi:pyruvate dehydrogenase E1 component alpha subunit